MTDPTPQTTPTRDEEVRREEQLRIQAVGAAISRRDWHAVEQAYNAIRDEFDRRPRAYPPAPASGGVGAVRLDIERILAEDMRTGISRIVQQLVELFERSASLFPAATPVSEAGGDWRSVLAGMVEAMNRYGHEVGDGDIPSAHRNLISQAERLLAETSVAKDVSALAIVRMFKERIERHGNWDEGCFYYGNTSASELQEPLRLAAEALAQPASSPAGGEVREALEDIAAFDSEMQSYADVGYFDGGELFKAWTEQAAPAIARIRSALASPDATEG